MAKEEKVVPQYGGEGKDCFQTWYRYAGDKNLT